MWAVQDGSELQFKIKRTTPLMKVIVSRSCYVRRFPTLDTPAMDVFNMLSTTLDAAASFMSTVAHTLCHQVFVAYCQRKGLTLEDCRFVADGNLLTAKGPEVTPEEV